MTNWLDSDCFGLRWRLRVEYFGMREMRYWRKLRLRSRQLMKKFRNSWRFQTSSIPLQHPPWIPYVSRQRQVLFRLVRYYLRPRVDILLWKHRCISQLSLDFTSLLDQTQWQHLGNYGSRNGSMRRTTPSPECPKFAALQPNPQLAESSSLSPSRLYSFDLHYWSVHQQSGSED